MILAILAGAVVLLLVNLEEVISAVQDKLSAYREQKQLEEMAKPYKNDKYGGATPEETFDLFIAALKKEDIDLASKYFVIPKQESWRKTLGEYKGQGLLIDFTVELENTQKGWKKNIHGNNKDIVEFYSSTIVNKETETNFNGQKIKVPAGEYSNTTRFEKYPSGVWKISVL